MKSSPNKGRSAHQQTLMKQTRDLSPPKCHIYLRSVFRFGFAVSSQLTWRTSASYVISVRHLAGLGEKKSGWRQLPFVSFRRQRQTRRLRTSSQASSPRFVTSPQLPSPRTVFSWELHLVYCLVVKETGTKYRGLTSQKKRHPTRSRPCWAYCNGPVGRLRF